VTDVPGLEGQIARLARADRVYVGWRYARLHDDPGPPPPEPEADPDEESQARIRKAALRRPGDALLHGPLRTLAIGTGVGVGVMVLLWLTGIMPGLFALCGLVGCLLVFGITFRTIWLDERQLRDRAREERDKLDRVRRARQRSLDAARRQHADAYREWERRRAAFEQQREWHPVTVPPGVDRVDIAGGTLAGWSAAVTMMGAARLAAGAQVTVVDLSEGSVAADLVRLTADHGEEPLVWILPDDLPRLDLTRHLGSAELADVLSMVVSASEETSSTRDLSVDTSILERTLSVLGGHATIPQITAALRALAQVGDPRDDLRRGLLSEGQYDRITTMFGRGAADKVVIERAWALESQLRKLEPVGSDPVPLPPSALHVVSLNRRSGVLTNRVLGTYVITSLIHGLRTGDQPERWNHTLFLCGAEKVRGDVLDRLTDACESTGTGLVLLFRSIPKPVRQRLGRGHAAVGFMRLGNAEDARAAAAHIGADESLVMAGVTEAAGDVLADVAGSGYASTVARARSSERPLTDPIWTPVRRPYAGGGALVEGLASSSTWVNSVLAPSAAAPFRELMISAQQLQELPPTAMVFAHPTAHGRRIELVDANPGIMALPTAQPKSLDQQLPDAAPPPPIPAPRHGAPPGVSPRDPASAPPLPGPPAHGSTPAPGDMPPSQGRTPAPGDAPPSQGRTPAPGDMPPSQGRHARDS
jgi:hypothetical protein